MKCYNFIALNNNAAIGGNHHRTGNNRTEESPDHKTKGNSMSGGETKISLTKAFLNKSYIVISKILVMGWSFTWWTLNYSFPFKKEFTAGCLRLLAIFFPKIIILNLASFAVKLIPGLFLHFPVKHQSNATGSDGMFCVYQWHWKSLQVLFFSHSHGQLLPDFLPLCITSHTLFPSIGSLYLKKKKKAT